MTLYQLITTNLSIPTAYGMFKAGQVPPYICLMGAGQSQFEADNTYYIRKDRWTIEYYFKIKDPDLEASIEDLLLENGYKYDKSEDIYIDGENVFVIYYNV